MKASLYLILFLAVVIATMGVMFLLGYAVLQYLLPSVREILDVSIGSSRWFFLVAIFTLSTGICLSFYTLEKSSDERGILFLSVATVSAGFSLFVQMMRMVVTGLAWIGIEILGTHANVRAVKIFSIGFAIFTLFIFTLCFSLWKEGRKKR